MKKVILHLCADIGSDSYYYNQDPNYEVIRIGQDIGVENCFPDGPIHGIIANPPCTSFSTANYYNNKDLDQGMFLVNHCLRIIETAKPKWWVLENPATGLLKNFIGEPNATYQPWEYGDPWTKKTALWGNFVMPNVRYNAWESVPKNDKLYIRPGREKPSFAFLHKSAIDDIYELLWAKDKIKNDADFRSLCSPGFAYDFYKANP